MLHTSTDSSTAGDSPHWRIASTSVHHKPGESGAFDPFMLYEGYNPLSTQYEKDFTPPPYKGRLNSGEHYDNFLAAFMSRKIIPVYWVATAVTTALSIANFVTLEAV